MCLCNEFPTVYSQLKMLGSVLGTGETNMNKNKVFPHQGHSPAQEKVLRTNGYKKVSQCQDTSPCGLVGSKGGADLSTQAGEACMEGGTPAPNLAFRDVHHVDRKWDRRHWRMWSCSTQGGSSVAPGLKQRATGARKCGPDWLARSWKDWPAADNPLFLSSPLTNSKWIWRGRDLTEFFSF